MAGGLLEVLVVAASGLPNLDFLNPYVVVVYKGQEQKTSFTRGQGSNAEWNQKLVFRAEYPGLGGDYITLKLMDHDTFSADDFIGEAKIHVEDLLALGLENGSYELNPAKFKVVGSDETCCGDIKVGVAVKFSKVATTNNLGLCRLQLAPPSSTTSGINDSYVVEIMEKSCICISPLHSYTLPLTFLDIPWLQFPPLQPLFFFQLPPLNHSSFNQNLYMEFKSNTLPRLKHSLSSALRYFFPLAGKLTVTHTVTDSLVFLMETGNSVGLTVASCNADFNDICSYLPKSAKLFQQLVPSLPTISSSTISTCPASILAIQITFFPNSSPGFSIGFASHPVLCDQRTFSNFLYCWAFFCKFCNLNFSPAPVSFDRSVILDSTGLHSILLEQWFGLDSLKMKLPLALSAAHCSLKSTFVMSPADISNARKWLQSQSDKLNRSHPVLLSPYVVTCAFVWTCFLKSHVQNSSVTKAKVKGLMYFGFIAGGITRLPCQVPTNYFGNCVGFGRAVAKREELLNEDEGMLAAADAIGLTIKKLDCNVLADAEKWISEWRTLIESDDHIYVVGSPKVNLYETDFGWGKPKKIEEISIDGGKAISLTQSRDIKGGIEIGLTLSNSIMDAFSTIFTQGLSIFAL